MMNRYILAAVFSVLTSVGTSYATELQSDESTLESLEQTWLGAATSQDHKLLEQLLDENYVEKMPDGRVLEKSDLLAAPPPSSIQQLQDIEVHVSGNTGVVWGVDHSVDLLTRKSQDIRYTHVYVRQDGKWRVITSDWMRVR